MAKNQNEYNILAITLARGGTKGVKKKNIYKINDIPLISYTIAEALRSKLITRYIVSTDDGFGLLFPSVKT